MKHFRYLPTENAIDFDYPRDETTHLTDTSDTHFGKHFEPLAETKPEGQSGFHYMVDGVDALATRLLLARKAEKCIDAQYYIIKDDLVGRLFLYVLLQAADRGVRVRLLLDDIFVTPEMDRDMAALCLHENFEIRVFNPFQRDFITGKALVGNLVEFARINRRMHNKTVTADNQVTIIGGRNMADEYFGVHPSVRFHDDDVLAIGPVVEDVSTMFDTYWNHETALPAPAFIKKHNVKDPKEQLRAVRDKLAASFRDAADSPYSEAVREKVKDYLATDAEDVFGWAPYELVVDSPDKGLPSQDGNNVENIITPLLKSLQKAEKQIIAISPYFVPMDEDIEVWSKLKRSGVDVTIITNSLAANNMFFVHGGYVPARKPLLKAGIKIYELRPDSHVEGSEHVHTDNKKRKSTLHSKAFIVDDKEVFVGSFNFDPRSVNLNTECGVVIRDSKLAQEGAQLVVNALPTMCYELFLNQHGMVQWRTMENGKEVILRNEPDTSLLLKTLGLFARLAPKSQL